MIFSCGRLSRVRVGRPTAHACRWSRRLVTLNNDSYVHQSICETTFHQSCLPLGSFQSATLQSVSVGSQNRFWILSTLTSWEGRTARMQSSSIRGIPQPPARPWASSPCFRSARRTYCGITLGSRQIKGGTTSRIRQENRAPFGEAIQTLHRVGGAP